MGEINQEKLPRKEPRWIILVIILLLFGFYWFFIRPGQIRQECYDYSYTTPNLGDTQEWTTATNYYYDACLKRKGLENH